MRGGRRPPLVSAVIIFCNEEEFLGEAVESVYRQTFTDWELILVDDGSTDGSTELARSCAADRPEQVRYLDHPAHERRGMSASRNLGVRSARGRYVAYLDADDRWLPEKLHNQLRLITDAPRAAVVYGPLVRWRSWTGGPEADDDYGIHGDGFTLATGRLYEPPELVAHFIRHKDLVPSGALFRREVFLDVGGADESFTDNYEDAVVFTKIGLRHPMYCAPESWYLYRQYPSVEHRERRRQGRPDADRPRGDQGRRRFLDWVERYLQEHAIREPLVRAALVDARRQVDHRRRHQAVRLARRGRRVPARVLSEARTMLGRR